MYTNNKPSETEYLWLMNHLVKNEHLIWIIHVFQT